MQLILGSGSLLKKKILERAGYNLLKIVTPNVRTSIKDSKTAEELAIRSAILKAGSALMQMGDILSSLKEETSTYVVSSSQVIRCNGKILDTPKNQEQARTFLTQYGEYPLECVNGVIVVNASSLVRVADHDIAIQHFDPIPASSINEILNSEPDMMKSPGAFSFSNPLLAPFMTEYDGSPGSMEGIPLSLLNNLIIRTSTVTIYHNPNCSKSRMALELLKNMNVEPIIIPYLQVPLNPEKLRKIWDMLPGNDVNMMHRARDFYTDIDSVIDLIMSDPTQLQRPIVVYEDKKEAAIGRPSSNIIELFD